MIVAVGYATRDISVTVPRFPQRGERVQATGIDVRPGGMAANAAAAAAAFGAEVAFVGAVGGADGGTMAMDDLAALGVDVSATRTDAFTTSCVIMVAADGDRAIISQDDAVGPSQVGDALRVLGDREGGILYLDGYRWPWAGDLLTDIDPRIHVAVDIDGLTDPEALPTIFSVASHLVASRQSLIELGCDDIDHVVRRLAAAHRTTAVVTAGRAGWWMTDGVSTWEGPAIEVATVDSTGAGDAFCGAYLAALDGGESPPDAARLAAAAAALSTTTRGARSTVSSRADADALLLSTTP